MLKDVVAVKPLSGYRLHLRFEDGVEGEIDISEQIQFRDVFKPLKDPAYFQKVVVDSDTGTVTWPNQADLDPDYSRLAQTFVRDGVPLGSNTKHLNAKNVISKVASVIPMQKLLVRQ